MKTTTTSSIFEICKLCIYASFIGYIILQLFLNDSQDSVNLASHGIEITSPTSSNGSNFTIHGKEITSPKSSNGSNFIIHGIEITSPTSSNRSNYITQSLQLSNLVKYRKEIDEAEKYCNIFEGKWVYDPEGSPLYDEAQCPFLSEQVKCQKNGRPDSEYLKWSWVANGCKIPRYNGKEMLERLRDKRVILVGDSLNRNQWESLACLLYSALSSSEAHVAKRSALYKVFKSKEYNCSLEFYWCPFLVKLKVNKANGNKILRLDKICNSAKKWNGADIMVFNTGLWWTHNGKHERWDRFKYGGKMMEKMEMETAFGIAMRSWGSWVDQHVDRNKTRVLFRNISPEHYGKQWCFNKKEPIIDESFVLSFPKAMVEIVEETMEAMKNPVTYLNITKLSSYRRDAHQSVYKTKEGKMLMARKRKHLGLYADCTHWCLPGVPDTWNRLLFASLFHDTSKNIPIS